jgi:hypothetical protein
MRGEATPIPLDNATAALFSHTCTSTSPTSRGEDQDASKEGIALAPLTWQRSQNYPSSLDTVFGRVTPAPPLTFQRVSVTSALTAQAEHSLQASLITPQRSL